VMLGGRPLPLPGYFLGEYVPLFSRLHFPLRFMIAGYLALTMLAVRGADWLLRQRVGSARVRWIAVLLVAAEIQLEVWRTLLFPGMMTIPREPRPATRKLLDADPYAVIMIPTLEQSAVQAIWVRYLEQRFHRRPTLGGMGSQFLIPGPLLDFIRYNPFLRALIAWGPLHWEPPGGGRTPEQGDLDVLARMGFRYVVFNEELVAPKTARRLRGILYRWCGPPEIVGDTEYFALPPVGGGPPWLRSVEESRRIMLEYLAEQRGEPGRGA